MRIVLGNNTLGSPGGTETYTLTVATQLQRLGHEVWVHANEQGDLSDAARSEGLRIPQRADALPTEVDAVVASDGIVALDLAGRYPTAPLVLIGHSDIFDFALAPRLPGLLSGAVALYDRVERRLRGADLGVPITRLAQPVDVELFKPLRSLPQRARVVLVLGNYMRGARLGQIERACERNGLELRHVGIHGRAQTLTPVQTLCEADIVIGKARVAIEAMAAGRATYVLDHNGGDGWVTAESYAVQAADNFGGQSTDVMIDEDRLTADLAGYDWAMGLVNRDLAVRHHAATPHAAELATLLQGLVPRAAPVPGPLTEMARLVRTAWQHEGHAFALYGEVDRLNLRLHESDVRLQAAERRAVELTHELEAARSAVLEAAAVAAAAEAQRVASEAAAQATAAREREAAEHARAAGERAARAEAAAHAVAASTQQRLSEFQATRRYRLAGLLAGPLDRLRGRNSGRPR